MVQTRKLRVLAVITAELRPDDPNASTMAEAGFPGFDRIGFMAPKGTPPAVTKRLHAVIKAAMAKPAVRDQLRRGARKAH